MLVADIEHMIIARQEDEVTNSEVPETVRSEFPLVHELISNANRTYKSISHGRITRIEFTSRITRWDWLQYSTWNISKPLKNKFLILMTKCSVLCKVKSC